jgi:NitT/TauT family transport system substrate-binding protein
MFINNTKGEDPSISEFLMENLIARPETIKKDPELVRRMVRALVKSNKWALSSTPEQVAEALKPTFAKTDPAIHLAGVRAVLPTLSQDGRTTEKSFQATQDVLEQAGLLKKRVAYGDIVSNEFLPK